MRTSLSLKLVALTACLTSLSSAEEQLPQSIAASETLTPAQEAVARIQAQFETVRMDKDDFKLSPGWELPLTIKAIEEFFTKPLDIPVITEDWMSHLENANTLSDSLALALDILGTNQNYAPKRIFNSPIESPFPLSLKEPVIILISAIKEARPFLNQAVDSVQPSIRQGFLALNEWPNPDSGQVSQEISAQKIKKQYEGMRSFSEKDLAMAGQIVFERIDQALNLIPKKMDLKKRLRWKTTQGDVLISGVGDDVYTESDLKDVSVLIDLGGKNIYKTPVAVAHEKEIRIVLDFGSDIEINSEQELRGDAGAGIFGIGVMVLPNSKGLKQITSGSFSQGCGIGGIGALVINGTAHLSAQRSAQGMGVFGVGLLSAKKASNSTYVATRSGQGSALTRGVGIFSHDGDNADIKGGLVQPDPREPLGSVSLCQGVGFGPRAYAGGGVGLALVRGNNNRIKGSYFSQGVGYWHGFGAFRLRGNGNTTQARRYDMGSGVHNAFGHMDVFGNQNRILNWGVGPSYGWDRAIGSSLVIGDENEMQTEWGSGTASIGSLSFSMIKGNRNKLKLCDFGTNNFFRDEPAYSIQIIDGEENRLQCQGVAETNRERLRRMRTPYSTFQMRGTSLEENLGLNAPEWPELPREEAVEKEKIDLADRLAKATTKSALEEVADLVDIAGAFSLDKTTPRQAMRDLLMLPIEKAALLIDVLEPMAIDQLIYISIAIPAHGDVTTKTILTALSSPEVSTQKKAVMLNFLRMARPMTVVPALLDFINKPWPEELKSNALRTLAALLNKDSNKEPGARAALIAALDNLQHPSKANKKRAVQLIGRMFFNEAFGLFATAADITPEDRAEIIDNAPEDLSGGFGEKSAEIAVRIFAKNKKLNIKNIEMQLATLAAVEPTVREKLIELLQSTRTASVNGAVVGLGKIGNKEDINALVPMLRHANTRVRESAVVALARIGEPALPSLEQFAKSEDPRDRALIPVAATQATSKKFLALIDPALNDSDPLVRLTAVAVISNISDSLQNERPKLIKYAKKKLSTEIDPDVHLALELLK